MKTGLYRIEVISNLLRNDPPKDDNCAMITDNDGITFARLHRVNIDGKPKKKNQPPCEVCEPIKKQDIGLLQTGSGYIAVSIPVRFCPTCGRYLYVEEAQE